MSLRRNLALLAALGLAAGGVGASGADFTSSSAGTGNGVSAARDWTPPAVSLANPGSPLQGAITLTATATDAISGVASVSFQGAPSGTTGFTTLCTDTAAPYTCAYDTTQAPTGRYDLRAIATDVDGNSATSLVDARWVDNTSPSTAITAPAGPLRGGVALNATTTSATGVDTVLLQRAPTGTSTWTTICTSASATPSCSWDTTQTPDGTYDLRSVLTTTSGRTATSALATGRRVDNTAPTGVDVQATNGPGTAGRIDAGDVITLTYSEAMQRASLISGWTSGTAALSVRVSNATPEVLTSAAATGGGTPALGSVVLAGNYVSALSLATPTYAATASLSADGRTVTVTLGTQSTALVTLTTSTTKGAMTWSPSAGALDQASNPAAMASVTEGGAADVDF